MKRNKRAQQIWKFTWDVLLYSGWEKLMDWWVWEAKVKMENTCILLEKWTISNEAERERILLNQSPWVGERIFRSQVKNDALGRDEDVLCLLKRRISLTVVKWERCVIKSLIMNLKIRSKSELRFRLEKSGDLRSRWI